MNRTEQLFGIIIKRLRTKGYEANYTMEEDGSISLVVGAHIDTVRCNVLLWVTNQQLENWRTSHKSNADGLTMTFKFNHDYPLNSFDAHRLHSTIVYATKCVPYAADEDNKPKKEEETNIISFNDVVKVLEEKGYVAFEESEEKAVFAIMDKDEPKGWYTTPECIDISTIQDDESKYCKFVIRIKPGFDVNEKTMNLLMEFAKDMPARNKSVNAEEDKEDAKMTTITEVVDALRKKGYSASVCDEKSFYVSRSDIMKAPKIPSGWVTDIASSSGLALRIINYDITDDSLKDLMQWVEQIPHGSSALATGAFNYNSPNANLSMYPGMANPFATMSCNTPFIPNPFNADIPMYPGAPNPFGLFGMSADNFAVNNAANMPMDFSNSTKVHKPDICDIMGIMSDENGELDVQKAKDAFGSYKKALKALFKYCKEYMPVITDDNDSED